VCPEEATPEIFSASSLHGLINITVEQEDEEFGRYGRGRSGGAMAMKSFRGFESVIRTAVLVGVPLIVLQTRGYGAELEPVVPGVVDNRIEIVIKNFDFRNTTAGSVAGKHILVVPAGMEVKWVNMDKLTTVNGEPGLMPHGIRIIDDSKKVFTVSPVLTMDHDSFTYTFNKNGVFTYSCFIHSFMRGKIMVITMPGDGSP
jgi:hypothetical protein